MEGKLEMSDPPFASASLVLSGRPDHKPGTFWGLDFVPPTPHRSVWLETWETSMILLKTFTEEDKHEGPVLGTWPLLCQTF